MTEIKLVKPPSIVDAVIAETKRQAPKFRSLAFKKADSGKWLSFPISVTPGVYDYVFYNSETDKFTHVEMFFRGENEEIRIEKLPIDYLNL